MTNVIYPISSGRVITAIGGSVITSTLASNLASIDPTFYIGTDQETSQDWLCREYDGVHPLSVTYTNDFDVDETVEEQVEEFILGQPRRPPITG